MVCGRTAPQGTSVLTAFSNTAAGSAPNDLTDFAGQLFFDAGGPIWQSDGTPEGTHPVPNWPADVSSSFLTPSGGRLFFDGADPVHGGELWKLELPGTIAGSAFVDTNHDGIRQPGEPDLAGATIYLDANGNGQLDAGETRTTTDLHGNYVFFNTPAGTYAVRQAPLAGYALTAPLGYAGCVLAGDAVASGPVFGDVPIASVPMNFDYLLTLAQHYG